jgi:lipopolysaccharide transport system ATP-binding protein
MEEFWALSDVSFDVKQGERVGIIGRNGAGKSTLLKILSRITEPTTGRVSIKGRIASLLEVGTGFHPELTGRENIYLNGAILGMSKAEIRKNFDAIVDFAGVEQFLDTPVKHYSSGMYVRLAFAVAAHLDTEILLVDEVLAVGDAEFQKKCMGKMDEVSHKEGRTILFVSHNMGAIRQISNRILFLQAGKIHLDTSDVLNGIESYSNVNKEREMKLIWYNTNKEKVNPWFTLLHWGLYDVEGHILSRAIDRHESLQIRFYGETQERNSSLAVGYALLSSEDSLIYISTFVDNINVMPKIGTICCFASEIPTQILNATRYKVSPMVFLHNLEWIWNLENSPQLEFEIAPPLEKSNVFLATKRIGLIAPLLPWNLTCDDACSTWRK